MIKYLFYSIFFLLTINSIAQDSIPKFVGDSLYREDQFYIAVSYNVFSSIPKEMNPEGVSAGVNLGFLRDFPFNKRRNFGMAIGAGFSYDQYGQNLLIEEDSNGFTKYSVLESDINYKYNRLIVVTIEAPIELRWRSSTSTDNKFWRVYAGFRVGYTLLNKATYKNSGTKITNTSINEFENLRFSTTLSVGYSKFNLFVKYNLNPYFNEDAITEGGEQVNFNGINLGLIFYIL
ncbi:MAG: PorT family protein [Flavobacteriaceae bacterium]|nr:PorT family protein [Flavobacteriaceae bacterium]